jgi:tetratricopeptide (TPR) repeat protein
VLTGSSAIAELLARADSERDAGRGADAARLYDEVVLRARAEGDLDGWTRAALGAASVQVFGAEPGKLPSVLYDVLARTTDDAGRARLGSALARCWVYAGEAARAAQFSEEAVERARRVGEPTLLADALDASLAAHWGPDELDTRRSLARELDDVTAHVPDPEARLTAHLWGLQVACEVLDVQAMHRQMRALERLGEESPKALFFAASRRQMLDLLRGRTDTAAHLNTLASDAAAKCNLPDAWMVLGSMDAYAAVQSGDRERAAAAARLAGDFALAEGSAAVSAEAAYWWVAAGRLDEAAVLIRTFHGPVLDALPRDVNWLLTLQCVLEVALVLDDRELIEKVAELLTPYAGRAVVNSGAVMFHGTTDDTLSRAYAVLGRADEASQLRDRALKTYEHIGAQWWRNRLASSETPGPTGVAGAQHHAHLHPTSTGPWLVGRGATPVAPLRGFVYLRELVSRPWQPVSALDLAGAGGPVVEETGLGEIADQQALAAYRQRLRELDVDITEAEDWADQGRLDAARNERAALLEEIARATGLGGRPRTSGSSQERARVAVKKAISTALTRIATVDEPLARHLRTHINTGLSCSYEPDPDVTLEWAWALADDLDRKRTTSPESPPQR